MFRRQILVGPDLCLGIGGAEDMVEFLIDFHNETSFNPIHTSA